ncbi:MAG TPA: preprotein translocase subunit SecG, partial [Sedimentisphaerales bacterium]|nr:preprotein translocase subunit SecG [Sedimentisphaerales bacterium]
GGGAGSILGSKTGDFLTWVTIILVGLFLLLAVVMGKFYRPGVSDFGGGAATRQDQPAGNTEGGAATGSDANLPSGESGS